MSSTGDRHLGTANEARPTPAGAAPAETQNGSPPPPADGTAHPDHQAADPATNPPSATLPPAARAPSHPWRRWLLWAGVMVGLAVGGYLLVPAVKTALNTVSTDDAYVNGYVTFVAPRVAGQVARVLVHDNYRVQRGALLVQLDREPYQVQVDIKKAAVGAAEADLVAAQAQVQAIAGQAHAYRYQLEHAIEDVHTQAANLRANVATLNRSKATLELARANLSRGEQLFPGGGISKEELDQRRQTVKVQEAAVDQALQGVYATRVGLGLPAQPEPGHDLGDVPADLDQHFSAVRQASGQLRQSAAQLGYVPTTWNGTPKQLLEEFYKQDPETPH